MVEALDEIALHGTDNLGELKDLEEAGSTISILGSGSGLGKVQRKTVQ